jgi:polysaccharide export outer membrane protein
MVPGKIRTTTILAILAGSWLALSALASGQAVASAVRGAAPDEGEGAISPSRVTGNPVAGSDAQKPYRIGVDDVLTISVWHEPDLSRSVPVRPDGKISLSLVGDVTAAGKTAMELEGQLKLALAKYLKDPQVTVIVSDIRSQRINVIGQVTRPGSFPLTQSMGVLDAVAQAGGLRDFAKKKNIYVLRVEADGRRVRIPYKYESVLKGSQNSEEVILQAHDTVVVP